jgi:hypothetical protein
MNKGINKIKEKMFFQANVGEKVLDTDVEKKDEWKNLNQRVEDLVRSMENNQKLNEEINSVKFVLSRGVFQGLGFVLGSTVFAGIFYYFFITYLGLDFLKEWTLDYVSKK